MADILRSESAPPPRPSPPTAHPGLFS
jgi:hypothetical protein